MYKLIVHAIFERENSNTVNFKYLEDQDAWCGAQFIDKERKMKVGDIIEGRYVSGDGWGQWILQDLNGNRL